MFIKVFTYPIITMGFPKSEQESLFNPALKYVESLAHLMDALDVMFLKSDLDGAYRVLMRIYNRVEHKFNEEECKPMIKLINEAIPLLNKQKTKNAGELNEILNNLDRELKRAMNKKGLLMPSKEDPRFAVLKR